MSVYKIVLGWWIEGKNLFLFYLLLWVGRGRMAAKVFERIVKNWVFAQFADHDGDIWKLRTLIDILIYEDVIPEHISRDQKLYKLLVMQIKHCVGDLVDVPSEGIMTPQMIDCDSAPTFLMMDMDASKKFEDLRHQLEAETGVNIYYYHCIKSIAANRVKRVRTKRLFSKH
jgi:hypothetical protein